MKLAVMTLVATFAVAAPAFGDNGQRLDMQAVQRAYSAERPFKPRHCFNGRDVAGANRFGGAKLYVQSRSGGIYETVLAGECGAMASAEKISLRSKGSDWVCARDPVDVIVHSSAGLQHCPASKLHKLSAKEAALLASAGQR